jgi:hypothetical protein
MRTAHRQLLHVTLAIGALILATATPTLAWSGPAPKFQAAQPRVQSSIPFSIRLLIACPLLDVISILGVVVDDGVPF